MTKQIKKWLWNKFTNKTKYSIIRAYKLHVYFIQLFFIFKKFQRTNLNKKEAINVSKKIIKVFAITISIILLIVASIVLFKIGSKNKTISNSVSESYILDSDNEANLQDTYEEKNEEIKNWQIEIPEISLKANIAEGTEDQTLKEFVGHFENTEKTNGNVGLAAHNRGYPINYFENLKNLKGGEEIIYTYGEFTKTYVVVQNIKISEVDWSYLQNTEENKITLITCIENEPAYRRCVQAIEKEEI